MRTKVKRKPNGRPEVEVDVQRRQSDRLPMTVEIDLDALRAAAARMNDPTCDPETAVETIQRKIAAGEADRLYTALMDEYRTIAPKETNGDAFGFIEMEFLALRQIMDDVVREIRYLLSVDCPMLVRCKDDGETEEKTRPLRASTIGWKW